ncbi:MAG: o-succinylbenzoate--CoA ligase [Bacteroidota bacterium]
MTLPDPIYHHAQTTPQAPALHRGARVWTYAELDAAVEGVARWAEAALPPGARVACYQPNGVPLIVWLLGLIRAGCTAVPLSTRIPPEQVPAYLDRVEAAACLTDAVVADARVISAALPRAAQPAQVQTWRADAPTTIIFSSGSTGEPKALVHSAGNHYYSALGSATNIPVQPGHTWGLTLPLYHVGGLAILFRCFWGGATVGLPDAAHDLEASVRSEASWTHLSLVPTQLIRLLRAGLHAPLQRYAAILLGGSAMPSGMLREAHAHGLPIHTSYGMTEMSSQIATTPPAADLDTLHTAGHVLPHRALRIADSGEVQVRGETLCLGRWEDGAVVPLTTADGWYATRDVGEIDDVGRLRITGRLDRQFISGGENIQPEQIERAMLQHDGVHEVIVVPVPDAEFGQRPFAFARTDTPLSLIAWRRFLDGRLPRFMHPVEVAPWPDEAPSTGLKWKRDAFQVCAERLYRSGSTSTRWVD